MKGVKFILFAAASLISAEASAQSLNSQTINGHISITGSDDHGAYTIDVVNGPLTIGPSGFSQTFNVFRQLTEGGFATTTNQINGVVTLNILGDTISVTMGGQVQPFELTNDFTNILGGISNASFSSTGTMSGVSTDLGGSSTSDSVEFSTFYSGYQTGTNVTQTAHLQFAPSDSAVPELSTWAMMLVGLGGIGFALRRSRPLPFRRQPA